MKFDEIQFIFFISYAAIAFRSNFIGFLVLNSVFVRSS